MALGRTSFLDAVNRVLQMLGEAPVNSLQGQFGLAKQAEDSLNDVSRTIQTEGWSFNTDLEKTLERNSSNEIELSSNVSRVVVDNLEYPDIDVVQRGDKLYDRRNNRYTFDADLIVDMTTILEWDLLPEHARQYITIKAGRQLQEAIIGSSDLTKLNLTQELEARSAFLEEETSKTEHSMLRGHLNRTSPINTYIPSRTLER